MADDNHAPAAEWRIVGETRPKPFRHARGNVLLSDFLCDWQEATEQIGAVFHRGRCVFRRSLTLHYRVLARLACLVEHAKSSSAAPTEKGEMEAQGKVPVQS